MDQTGLARPAVCRFFKKIQKVIVSQFQSERPMMLGAPGSIVECDESYFAFRRKYNRGRTSNPVWVFGMCDRRRSPAIGWTEIVTDRKKETLHPLIQKHVRKGTTINTDRWPSYKTINVLPEGYVHEPGWDDVDHSRTFVNPRNRITHTQTIESYWSKQKYRIKCLRGLRREHLELFLRKCSWRDLYQKDAFYNIIETISDIYDVYPSEDDWTLYDSNGQIVPCRVTNGN